MRGASAAAAAASFSSSATAAAARRSVASSTSLARSSRPNQAPRAAYCTTTAAACARARVRPLLPPLPQCRVGGVWRGGVDHRSIIRAASTKAAPAADSTSSSTSVPTIFTPAVHTRLAQMKARHAEVETELNALHSNGGGGGGSGNAQRLAALSKELAELGEVVDLAGQLEGKRSEVSFLEQAVEDPDPEMAAMAKEDLEGAREAIAALEQAVLRRLVPRGDEGDEDRGLILEVRAGTGGDEASLFAGEVFGMYERFARRNQWRFEVLSSSKNEFGGLKEAAAAVQGSAAYPTLKYESGVHRVQRVPVNDSRLHTSAATVAVLPEPQEVDFKLEPKDLKFDVFRASGAGGQHVNTTESAVRVTHLPTGIVVSIQDERSQHKNKDKAVKILRARVYEKEKERIDAAQASERRSQVGSGDRSERIRTYNFAQDRVTDHRISLSKHGIDRMMEGELLEEFTDALRAADEAERLQRFLEGK